MPLTIIEFTDVDWDNEEINASKKNCTRCYDIR
jgi:hypothetical protein